MKYQHKKKPMTHMFSIGRMSITHYNLTSCPSLPQAGVFNDNIKQQSSILTLLVQSTSKRQIWNLIWDSFQMQ